MKFNLNTKVQKLIGKGISVEDALSLIDVQASKGMVLLRQGDHEVKRLIQSNLFECDLTKNYRKMLDAGLTEKEALTIYTQRFSLWFPQVKVACMSLKYGNSTLLGEGTNIEIH